MSDTNPLPTCARVVCALCQRTNLQSVCAPTQIAGGRGGDGSSEAANPVECAGGGRNPTAWDGPVVSRSERSSRQKVKRPELRCWPKPARRPGRLLVGDDPPSISASVLPFVSIDVHRPSAQALAGDAVCQADCRLPDSLPTVPSWSTRLAGCPVRLAFFAGRLFNCPGYPEPYPVAESSPGRPRFRLVNPVGPPHLAGAIAGVSLDSVPFLGFRLACAVRYEDHCAPYVSAGQEVFLKSQGYPPNLPFIPRSFLFIHRSRTGCAQATR